jgi:hypothetical protein
MAYALAVFVLHFLGDMAAPPAFGAIAEWLGTGETSVRPLRLALILAATCCFVAPAPPPATPRPPAPSRT